MAILDVWIAKPGNACRVDDSEWILTLYDAHQVVYEWAGTSFGALPAPKGHWAGRVPPGTYVAQAKTADGSVVTDHAIAEVGCDGSVCVRLFVSGEHRPEPSRCHVTIKDVTGIGDQVADSIRVRGKATGCKEVEVTVSCLTREARSVVVSVSSGGSWEATLNDMRSLECLCDGRVSVVARCVEHPDCMGELVDKLRCERPGGDIIK